MEEKKSIKISLSTFFLILAIIIIIIMGCFIYFIYSEKNSDEQKINDLENQLSNITEQLNKEEIKANTTITNQVQTETNVVEDNNVDKSTISTIDQLTCSSLKGVYKAKIEDVPLDDGINEVSIILCENGTFAYYFSPTTDAHDEGYYTINEDTIILHVLLGCANDPGAKVIDETVILKINSDNSLTDNNKLNVTLKKSSDIVSEEVNLSNSIRHRLDYDYLY